jgi:hypothetical protein
MNKILGIALTAAVLAGQATAATIDGPGEVIVGQSYELFFNSGPVDLINKANLFYMTLKLPDGRSVLSGGSEYPANNLFSFNWVFKSTGETTLDVIAELRSYSGVIFEQATNYPIGTLIPINLNTSPSRTTSLEASRIFRVREAQEISVVPIGGTLPLMLSALGVMGWVARRRRAQAKA